MEFIFQLMVQLFGSVEDGINDVAHPTITSAEQESEICCYESEKEVEPLPYPNFFNGISFH